MNSNEKIGNKSDISGFILAGGKSRRMGTDKAFLLVREEPLLKRMISLVEPFCNEITISGQNSDYKSFNVNMIPDVFSGCGPISGLYSSLKHSSFDWNLIVSVDVPFVNEELIRFLISNAVECECVIPEHHAGIEPLVGMYNKNILPVIERMIKIGDYKLMNLLSKLNTRYVDCNNLIRKNPRLFFNVNRPQDYKSI